MKNVVKVEAQYDYLNETMNLSVYHVILNTEVAIVIVVIIIILSVNMTGPSKYDDDRQITQTLDTSVLLL